MRCHYRLKVTARTYPYGEFRQGDATICSITLAQLRLFFSIFTSSLLVFIIRKQVDVMCVIHIYVCDRRDYFHLIPYLLAIGGRF